jgi:hypothetical protein
MVNYDGVDMSLPDKKSVPTDILVKFLTVRSAEPHFAQLSITGEDHRVYRLTTGQLRLMVRVGMEVLSRLERGH